MAYESLLKKGQLTGQEVKSSFSTLSAHERHRADLQKDQLWQSIMLNQGELDYFALLIKNGDNKVWPQWLQKRLEFLEKNILFTSNIDLEDPADTEAVNRKVDVLEKYRAEMRQIKEALLGRNDAYLDYTQQQISQGVKIEETLVADLQQYLEVLGDKVKFGGIIDRNRLSRLCGFGAQAGRSGDLIISLKAYSAAGMLASMYNDFRQLIRKNKKQRNPQSQEAEDLLYKLVPFNKKAKKS